MLRFVTKLFISLSSNPLVVRNIQDLVLKYKYFNSREVFIMKTKNVIFTSEKGSLKKDIIKDYKEKELDYIVIDGSKDDGCKTLFDKMTDGKPKNIIIELDNTKTEKSIKYRNLLEFMIQLAHYRMSDVLIFVSDDIDKRDALGFSGYNLNFNFLQENEQVKVNA